MIAKAVLIVAIAAAAVLTVSEVAFLASDPMRPEDRTPLISYKLYIQASIGISTLCNMIH